MPRPASACRTASLVWTGPQAGDRPSGSRPQGALPPPRRHGHEIGATHLVTAHTLDDQAETVLMRIARGSGLAGLSGMRAVTVRSGLCHVRPLLGLPKADLLEPAGRKAGPSSRIPPTPTIGLPGPAGAGSCRSWPRRGSPRSAWPASRSGSLRSEEALDAKAREAFARASVTGPDPSADEGIGLRLHGPVLLGEPFEIALRALRIAVERYRGDSEFLRLERLEACTERFCAALSKRRKPTPDRGRGGSQPCPGRRFPGRARTASATRPFSPCPW